MISYLPLLVLLAQTPKPANLFATVSALDTKLFDAYNRCDLVQFGSMLTDDLEFYHDIGGFSRGRQDTVDAVKNNICGKVIRKLVPGTLEVYPIAGFGALEIGTHRFYHPGQNPDEVGEGKFAQIWENKNGQWKLSRVISYDHHAVK